MRKMLPLEGQCEDGMTCARTADRSLYFLLLAVKWTLEPLLPREKTGVVGNPGNLPPST
jgi:hypothetical protein